ncbi:MAG: ABC transporter ATP-binding protein [Gammaproteobacteria bacterium]
MPMPAIRAHGLSRSFVSGRISRPILSGLSLDILPGELTLICGPSGCGKSTLLALLGGLLRPDAGRVTVMGKDLWAMDEAAIEAFRLRHVGFVFQHFHLFPSLRAWEQVALLLGYMGIDGREARRRAIEVLAAVGLADRIDALPAELSGGEQQRVAIARAMAKRPGVIFADEPTSALDAASGQVVIDSLHRVARSAGTTVLCVSHDSRLISHADRVLTIEDGRILADRRMSRPAGAEVQAA